MSNLPNIDIAASLRGRTALVTGGSRGIGRCVVESLLAHGARVAFTYNRHEEDARALAEGHPEGASCHFLELRDRDSVARCFSDVQSRWGDLHILVNNAAAGSATIEHYEPDPTKRDDALVDINAVGSLRVCQGAIHVMKQQPSSGPCKIINVSSVGGIQVFPSMRLADNMSKAAVVYMTQQLAAELVRDPIDVFAVCPGATDTEMLRKSTLDKLSDDARPGFIANLPKGRLIAPQEVADVILFLASAYSTVLHGAILDLSMGLGVHPGLLTGQLR